MGYCCCFPSVNSSYRKCGRSRGIYSCKYSHLSFRYFWRLFTVLKKGNLSFCACLPAASKSCAIMSTHIVACLLLYRHRQVRLLCPCGHGGGVRTPCQPVSYLVTNGHGPVLASALEISSKGSQVPCPQELTDLMEESHEKNSKTASHRRQ